MEFGVFFGASILMWRDYFPSAEVVGVDTFAGKLGHGPSFPEPRKFLEKWQNGTVGPRIKLIEADQAKLEDLERVVAAVSGGDLFDLIVDDASHKNRDQQLTLALLFPLVRPGGIFVMEDIHTSAQSQYDERPLSHGTSMQMMIRFEAGKGKSRDATLFAILLTSSPPQYIRRRLPLLLLSRYQQQAHERGADRIPRAPSN